MVTSVVSNHKQFKILQYNRKSLVVLTLLLKKLITENSVPETNNFFSAIQGLRIVENDYQKLEYSW
jgi:hypothetical protein